MQHKNPTAIAQIYQYLRTKQGDKLFVASVPLVKYYLESQGLEAVYIPIKLRMTRRNSTASRIQS